MTTVLTADEITPILKATVANLAGITVAQVAGTAVPNTSGDAPVAAECANTVTCSAADTERRLDDRHLTEDAGVKMDFPYTMTGPESAMTTAVTAINDANPAAQLAALNLAMANSDLSEDRMADQPDFTEDTFTSVPATAPETITNTSPSPTPTPEQNGAVMQSISLLGLCVATSALIV